MKIQKKISMKNDVVNVFFKAQKKKKNKSDFRTFLISSLFPLLLDDIYFNLFIIIIILFYVKNVMYDV